VFLMPERSKFKKMVLLLKAEFQQFILIFSLNVLSGNEKYSTLTFLGY